MDHIIIYTFIWNNIFYSYYYFRCSEITLKVDNLDSRNQPLSVYRITCLHTIFRISCPLATELGLCALFSNRKGSLGPAFREADRPCIFFRLEATHVHDNLGYFPSFLPFSQVSLVLLAIGKYFCPSRSPRHRKSLGIFIFTNRDF